MALALIYIFATAKPISIRRLSALFTLTLILSTLVKELFSIRDGQSYALVAAASLTVIVWITPLLQVLRDSICYRRLSLRPLRPVSTVVQLTYGFALAAVPTIAIAGALIGTRGMHPVVLLRLVTIAGVTALVLQAGLQRSRL